MKTKQVILPGEIEKKIFLKRRLYIRNRAHHNCRYVHRRKNTLGCSLWYIITTTEENTNKLRQEDLDIPQLVVDELFTKTKQKEKKQIMP